MAPIPGAALFAQILESSSGLLRPFGYYGAVIGVIATAAASRLWGEDGTVVLAAFSVAAPLMHAIGRGRCLIQGCCHGRPAPGLPVAGGPWCPPWGAAAHLYQ